MTVETASYISELNTAWPADGDYLLEGDNHQRLIKSVLQSQFPNFEAAAVSLTVAELNGLPGDISALDTRLSALESDSGGFRIGDIMWSGAAGAPTNFLLCDGMLLVKTSYPDLNTAIGNTYGGDAAQLALPDLRGRTAMVSGTGSGLTPRTAGEQPGSETHLLTAAQSGVGAHTHPVRLEQTGQTANQGIRVDPFDDSGDGEIIVNPGGIKTPPNATEADSKESAAVGASEAHNIVQPGLVLYAYIRVL